MRKKIKIYLLIILTSSGILKKLNAQLPPTVDTHWELNTIKSDEFNSTTLDITKWDALDPWNGIGFNWGGGQWFRPNNVSVDGNNLQLKVEEINPTHPKHWSGGVQSKNPNYSYGYFEIRAKLPGFYDNGQPTGEGFWPAFWTYYTNYSQWPCYHDEIDILEPSGSQYADGKTNVMGHWDLVVESLDPNLINGVDCHGVKYNEYTYTNTTPLFDNFHKYATEWLPDRINYYFDDILISSNYNVQGIPTHDQFIVIDQQLDGAVPLNPNTPMPSYMTIDYFRYYQLKKDCNTNAFINNNTDLNNFNYAVKNNIIIGAGSTVVSLNFGEIKTFRAVNEITINGDFTVPLGSELNLIPTPCN